MGPNINPTEALGVTVRRYTWAGAADSVDSLEAAFPELVHPEIYRKPYGFAKRLILGQKTSP